jgi:hypothetical protein
MLPPPGYDSPKGVIYLKRAVYGLRQAPLAWYKQLAEFLKSINFKVSMSDPCVFRREQQGNKPLTWIFSHINDLVIIKLSSLHKNRIPGLKVNTFSIRML